jgi:hypothetical protein
MTRAVVFLAATLVAASLGVVAQENRALQNDGENLQSSASSQPEPQNQTSRRAAAGANDSARQTATGDGANNVSVKAAQDQETATSNLSGQPPQTSTILPLLGLIGLGSLVAGFFARR